MRKSLPSAFCVATGLMIAVGSGSAAANNEYSGQTYADAASAISSSGGSAVVATKEGSYLPLDECVVTGSRQSNGKVLLDLNCNDTSALNGHPGNSVTTPSGKKVQEVRNTADQISENFAEANAAGGKSWCEENQSDCAQFCQGAGDGLCSDEVMQFLGA